MRTCVTCETEPVYVAPSGHVSSYCSECKRAHNRRWHKERGGHTETTKRARQTPEYKEKRRASHYRRTYGISMDDYEGLLRAQKNVCAICKGPPDVAGRWSRLLVDHDHQTGEVRGLLCNLCNSALGYFRDDRSVVLRAADYLRGQV